MSRDFLEKLNSHVIKFRKLIFFQSAELNGEEMEDLLGTQDDKDLSNLCGFNTEGINTDAVVETIEETFTGKFFAEAHTPLRKYRHANSCSYSWDHTTYEILVADTFEELVEKACAWAESEAMRAREKAQTDV